MMVQVKEEYLILDSRKINPHARDKGEPNVRPHETSDGGDSTGPRDREEEARERSGGIGTKWFVQLVAGGTVWVRRGHASPFAHVTGLHKRWLRIMTRAWGMEGGGPDK